MYAFHFGGAKKYCKSDCSIHISVTSLIIKDILLAVAAGQYCLIL